SKKPVALLDSGNGYVDFDYVLNQYARMLIRGQSVTIDEIAGRTDVRKAEVPERIYMVTSEAGSLVRQEKKLGSQGGTGFDLENFDDQGTQVKKNPESITDQENFGEDEQEKINPTEDEEINNSTPEKETALEETSITGSSRVTISQAQAWAKSKNAHQRFVEITPVYWEYGKKTGIRPEVMYAQAALETGYGHYKGQVPASFNNWAGIKVGHSNGDNPEDHEKFATPEEGVRGHFNHMSAYVGLQPVGEPHDRYYSVKSIAWAGTVEYVEELSGKWAPSSTYHETIVRMIGEMK
ncbi:MAG: glucosaminidase domain-containing protein, partial [Bacillota bacterium]